VMDLNRFPSLELYRYYATTSNLDIRFVKYPFPKRSKDLLDKPYNVQEKEPVEPVDFVRGNGNYVSPSPVLVIKKESSDVEWPSLCQATISLIVEGDKRLDSLQGKTTLPIQPTPGTSGEWFSEFSEVWFDPHCPVGGCVGYFSVDIIELVSSQIISTCTSKTFKLRCKRVRVLQYPNPSDLSVLNKTPVSSLSDTYTYSLQKSNNSETLEIRNTSISIRRFGSKNGKVMVISSLMNMSNVINEASLLLNVEVAAICNINYDEVVKISSFVEDKIYYGATIQEISNNDLDFFNFNL